MNQDIWTGVNEDRWTEVNQGRWTDTDSGSDRQLLRVNQAVGEMEAELNGQTDKRVRQTDSEPDRWIDSEQDRWTDKG